MTDSAHEPRSPSALALDALLRKVRSPEGERVDLEALVVALQRPVEPGQDVRGLEEVLNHILEDPFIGGMRGSTGLRVEELAARALEELGGPRPPGAPRAVPARDAPEAPQEEGRSWQVLVSIPFVLLALFECLSTASGLHPESRLLFRGFSVLTLVVPTLVLMLSRRAWLQGLVGILLMLFLVFLGGLVLFFILGWGSTGSAIEVLGARAVLALVLLIACAVPRRPA